MDQIRKDLVFAIRMIVKNPGLSLIVIVTFSLGIGLTTTVFSIVNGALFKGLPFEDADRVMALGRTNPSQDIQNMGVSVHDLVDWAEQQTVFEDMAAILTRTVNLAGTEGRPERYRGAFVTASLFDVLEVHPALGRAFQQGDDQPGAEPVIILGFDVWQQRYGGSPDVLGKTVRANGEIRTIVGVAPAHHVPAQQGEQRARCPGAGCPRPTPRARPHSAPSSTPAVSS